MTQVHHTLDPDGVPTRIATHASTPLTRHKRPETRDASLGTESSIRDK